MSTAAAATTTSSSRCRALFSSEGDEATMATAASDGEGGEKGAFGARDPGGLGNQLVKFNYRVRGGGSCLETCERGWSKGGGGGVADLG